MKIIMTNTTLFVVAFVMSYSRGPNMLFLFRFGEVSGDVRSLIASFQFIHLELF